MLRRELPLMIGFSVLFGSAMVGLAFAPSLAPTVSTPSPGLKPLSASAIRGREIYKREGCVYCHSQQVRPVKADENYASLGGVSRPGDYYYDRPNFLGTIRTGPDLSNEGRVWAGPEAREYLIGHFKKPREYNENSVMPGFTYLSDQELNDLTDYMQWLGAWKPEPS